jgi:hypothetical protein
MHWIEVLTIMGGNIAVILPMFFWLRSEGNADRREHAADRRDLLQMMRDFQSEMKSEMKDFHGRLCAIEERNSRK